MGTSGDWGRFCASQWTLRPFADQMPVPGFWPGEVPDVSPGAVRFHLHPMSSIAVHRTLSIFAASN